MKTKDSVGPLINDNGDVIRDGPCVASKISKYFVSVFFSAEDTNNISIIDTSIYRDINMLSHIELSLCTVYKKLKKLKQ